MTYALNIAALLIGLLPAQAPTTPLHANPIPLSVARPALTHTGTLRFVAGFHLTSEDRRFGGVSGIDYSADGHTLVAISDRGFFFLIPVERDTEGRLVGFGDIGIHDMTSATGVRLTHRGGDAEEVTRLADNRFVVSFEHHHRLGIFGPLAALSHPSEGPFPSPPALQSAPPNGGIEAFTQLRDGRLFAVREKPNTDTGSFPGWLFDTAGHHTESLTYRTRDGYQPTSLAALPDGGAVALERRFSVLTGVASRIVRIDPAKIRPGAVVTTKLLGLFGGDIVSDNFEALATRVRPDGTLRLTVMSDNNYKKRSQRTLLLQLALP